MDCADALRVQAYFDGEVDALSAVEIERHVEHCAPCRTRLRDLDALRNVVRAQTIQERAPQMLRTRIWQALERENSTSPRDTRPASRRGGSIWRVRTFWIGVLGGLGTAAAASLVAFLLLSAAPRDALLEGLVANHVRSLMPAHLIDVASSDQHTVKPWFDGRTDVSPVVADFAPQGYRLIGGRADYLLRQRAAVVVYQHGRHIINVFSWASDSSRPPRDTTRDGYRMAFWSQAGVQYCAVSDTGWDDLHGLVRLLRAQD